MHDTTSTGEKSLFVDRRALLKTLAEVNAATGFVPVPGGTARHARELMLAQGIRPEDNEGTRDMIALRYPDEEDQPGLK